MRPFEFELKTLQNFPVIFIKGYFSDQAGKKLEEVVDELLKAGQHRIVVDFAGCPLINSPGVVALANISMIVVEDYRGKVVLTNLDELKIKVLNVAGVFPTAQYSGTLEEGLQAVSQKD